MTIISKLIVLTINEKRVIKRCPLCWMNLCFYFSGLVLLLSFEAKRLKDVHESVYPTNFMKYWSVCFWNSRYVVCEPWIISGKINGWRFFVLKIIWIKIFVTLFTQKEQNEEAGGFFKLIEIQKIGLFICFFCVRWVVRDCTI